MHSNVDCYILIGMISVAGKYPVGNVLASNMNKALVAVAELTLIEMTVL